MKVVIFGSTGLLGQYLVKSMSSIDLICPGYPGNCERINVTSKNDVFQFLTNVQPRVIINLVALTNVDQCEVRPEKAFEVNSLPTSIFLEWINANPSINCRLIHVSTDQLYSLPGYSKENDIRPVNVYGITKLLADQIASSCNSIVLRTCFFGKSMNINRSSLTDWLFSELASGHIINAFDDVFFNPVSIMTLCQVIQECIMRESISGIFNIGARQGISKADFATFFAGKVGFSSDFVRHSSILNHRSLKAPRPFDMRMDCTNASRVFQTPLPDILDEINRTAEAYL